MKKAFCFINTGVVGIMKILIIGGSDVGVNSVLRAREIESGSKVTF